MLVQFLTNDQLVLEGFKALFHYVSIEPNCVTWLNLHAQILESKDYPTINCNWVVTAPLIDSTISIHFETFEVNVFSLYVVYRCLHNRSVLHH